MSAVQRALKPRGEGQALKRTGLLAAAILAALALFGPMASSASAKEQKAFFLAGEKSEEKEKQPQFKGESYPTYLAGDADTVQQWTFQGAKLKCPAVEFTGKLSAASTELSLITFYSYFSCAFGAGGALTIVANGCEDTITALNVGPPYVANYGRKCPAGKSYELIEHFESGATCTYALAAQTGVKTINLTNKGEAKKRAVQVAFNMSGLKYTISTSSPFTPCAENVGTYENGTYTGTITLEGFNE